MGSGALGRRGSIAGPMGSMLGQGGNYGGSSGTYGGSGGPGLTAGGNYGGSESSEAGAMAKRPALNLRRRKSIAGKRGSAGRSSLVYLTGVRQHEDYSALAIDESDIVEGPELTTYEGLQVKGQEFLSSTLFQSCVGLLIVANAAVIGFETDYEEWSCWVLVERAFLAAFTMELVLRVLFFGPVEFFDVKGPDVIWNVFDTLVVLLGAFDTVFSAVWKTGPAKEKDEATWATMFRMIRLLRILRVFRIIRFVRQLYILAYGFALAGVAVFWVMVLMASGLYICAVVLVRTLGHSSQEDPDFPFFKQKFGSVPEAMFTLFQLTVQPELTEYHDILIGRPFLTVFLVSFVFFGSLGMIALLTGVLSEAMFEKNMLRMDEGRQEREYMIKEFVVACGELFDTIGRNSLGETQTDDVHAMLPEIAELFDEFQVPYTRYDLESMISVMDTDGSGAINRTEFCRGILQMAQEIRPMLVMELHHESMRLQNSNIRKTLALLKGLESQLDTLSMQESPRNESLVMRITEAIRVSGPGDPKHAQVPAERPSERPSPSPPKSETATEEHNKLLAGVQEAVRSMQGDLFSLGARMEELLADARCERTHSQLSELAELRRSREPELKDAVERCEALGLKTQRAVDQLVCDWQDRSGRKAGPDGGASGRLALAVFDVNSNGTGGNRAPTGFSMSGSPLRA